MAVLYNSRQFENLISPSFSIRKTKIQKWYSPGREELLIKTPIVEYTVFSPLRYTRGALTETVGVRGAVQMLKEHQASSQLIIGNVERLV